MGDIIDMNGKKLNPAKFRKFAPLLSEIIDLSEKMDFFIGIGRIERRGKYEYFLFGNEMDRRTKLDLVNMLYKLAKDNHDK